MTAVTPAAIVRFGATRGSVHLVGAGPGDPGLLTVRAASLLASADVVFHDQLVTPEVIALVGLAAEVVPVGRRCGEVMVTHAEVIDRMASAAAAGLAVVRLKGGDPTVFGRGGEEALELLGRGVAVELVPGVTSAVAGPALAGVPVTHRGLARGFLAVTAHGTDGFDHTQWDVVAAFDGTVVVLMGRRLFGRVTARLVAGGRHPDQPAAAIAWAGTPAQQVVTGTLATIAADADDAGLATPALLVLGETVALRSQLAATAPRGRPTAAAGTVVRTTHGESGRPG